MPVEPHYKYCPVCRSEYTLIATRCIDCDVDLVDADALPAEEELQSFPPASELECVRVAPMAWIRALSAALQKGGVAHRVEPATAENAPEEVLLISQVLALPEDIPREWLKDSSILMDIFLEKRSLSLDPVTSGS